MKKHNLARIIVLVLSFALIIGSAFAITAMAEETTSTGEFGGISVAYGDKVAIRVAVDATKEEIENGDVVVSYTVNGKTADATYKETDGNGTVWVMTEGIAADDLASEVVFSSTVNGATVESGRTYSVAQFIYTMLYTKDITEADRNLYEALLAYGEAAQVKLGINTDKLPGTSTLVYTNNENITVNGKQSVFAPAADAEVTPVWNGTVPTGSELVGWLIADKDGNKTKALDHYYADCIAAGKPVMWEEMM